MTPRFQILFLLGAPCSGKGTIGEILKQSYKNIGILSAGDCLREAREDPSNTHYEEISTNIARGSIVPGYITANLLKNKMYTLFDHQKITHFIIDGFPRNQDNLDSFKKAFGLKSDNDSLNNNNKCNNNT